MLEIEAQIGGAVEVAAHIGTNANVYFRRRGEMKVRIKTGDAVNLIERRAGAQRKGFELGLRQEAMAMLNGSQIVEDHVASRLKRAQR